jgi:hypothetical protein
MMAYRIVRSPERKVFKVDVGNIAAQDVEQFMQRFITSMKRNQIVDPETGRVDLRYNPLSVEEDYFIPIRGGTGTTIETLPGGTYAADIDDVKYLQQKMFAALKIPQSYLIRGEGGEEDKGALAQKDIRFARTVQRLQRSLVTELEKIAIIHLYVLGFRNDDLLSFKIKLNNPSKISEMQELETWRTKFEIASNATEGFFSKRWIANTLFDVSDEEFLRNQREIFYDRQVTQQLETLAAPAEEGFGEGAGGLGGGGELGGEDLGGEELGGEELGGEELGGEGELGSEDESPLLAAPAKRDDAPTIKYINKKTGETTTNKSKAKAYKPVKTDKRDMGARTRQFTAMGSHEAARMPSRQTRMNLPQGAKELLGLGKGIFENKTTNYDKEESEIFEVKEEVKKLFEQLEQI